MKTVPIRPSEMPKALNVYIASWADANSLSKLEAEDGTGLQSLIDSIMNVADVTQTGYMLVSSRDALDCLDPIPA